MDKNGKSDASFKSNLQANIFTILSGSSIGLFDTIINDIIIPYLNQVELWWLFIDITYTTLWVIPSITPLSHTVSYLLPEPGIWWPLSDMKKLVGAEETSVMVLTDVHRPIGFPPNLDQVIWHSLTIAFPYIPTFSAPLCWQILSTHSECPLWIQELNQKCSEATIIGYVYL